MKVKEFAAFRTQYECKHSKDNDLVRLVVVVADVDSAAAAVRVASEDVEVESVRAPLRVGRVGGHDVRGRCREAFKGVNVNDSGGYNQRCATSGSEKCLY